MAEAAFSEDGKYYCSLSKDGRLRIWDTETNVLKQEFTPDLHLTSPPSCVRWLNIAVKSNSPNKVVRRKSSNSENSIQCIALGTTSGKVLLYSLVQARVETVLSDENDSELNSLVTSLDWHKIYGLYSCNKDSIVIEWDLQNASVKNKYNINIENKNKQVSIVSAIKIVPHNQKTTARYLIATSWQVRLWRLDNGAAVVVRRLGHNASPKALLLLGSVNDKTWLIEGSQSERLLSFWDVTITSEQLPQVNGDDVTPNKKQRRKSMSDVNITNTPTYNFVLEDAPKILDVKIKDDNGTKLTLAAATRSGVVHYYEHLLNGTSNKPIKPSVTIQVTSPDANPFPLHCCCLPSGDDVLLGYTQGPTVIFEKVTPDLKTKTQVLIRGDIKESKKKKNKTNEVNKVRSDENNDSVTYLEPMGGVSRKRPTPGGKVEVPMEQRLSNLTLDIKSRSKSAVNQNLTKLLVQGLHSKNKELIMTVLQKDDPAVAARTVSNLPADYVPQLLEQLIDMGTRKTSQCACVSTWVSALLHCHSALLLATVNGQSSDTLTHLLAIFTHRRSHLCQLLNIKGRLELTITQRSLKDNQVQDQEPLLNYQDTSSDEEMELDGYKSDSASEVASWEDRPSENSEGGSEDDDGD